MIASPSLTATSDLAAGLVPCDSLDLIPWIVLSVLVGVSIGAWLIRRIRAETFRRVCMSFDAWIVAFGLSALLRELHIVDGPASFLVLLVVIVIDAVLYQFFGAQSDARGFSRANQSERKASGERAIQAQGFSRASNSGRKASAERPGLIGRARPHRRPPQLTREQYQLSSHLPDDCTLNDAMFQVRGTGE